MKPKIQQKCTECERPSLPNLPKGYGKCAAHWEAGLWGNLLAKKEEPMDIEKMRHLLGFVDLAHMELSELRHKLITMGFRIYGAEIDKAIATVRDVSNRLSDDIVKGLCPEECPTCHRYVFAGSHTPEQCADLQKQRN